LAIQPRPGAVCLNTWSRFLKHLKISHKLLFAFSVIIAVVLAMSGAVYAGLSSVQSATTANETSHAILAAADDALSALVENQNAVRGYVATGDASFLPRIAGYQKEFDAAVSRLATLYTAPDAVAAIAALQSEAASISDQQSQVIAMAQNPATAAQARAALLTTGRLTKARATIQAIAAPQLALVAGRGAAQSQATEMAGWMLAGGCVLSVFAALAMGWLLARSIGGPVTSMTAAMTRLAEGDTRITIPAAGRRDEVGHMADAVQAFKDAAIEKRRLEAEAAAQRELAEVERRRQQAEREAAARLQEAVVEALATGLDRLSGGNLIYRLHAPFSAEYEKLRDDFNKTMEWLQQTISAIAANALAVRSGSGEINQAADDLARRSEQTAASLEQTVAALDQITTTVRKSALSAQDARNAVLAAKSGAETSGVVVQNTVQAMGEIESSSREIAKIIGVIADSEGSRPPIPR
jgi:methyl-accepting chemotaxis protein